MAIHCAAAERGVLIKKNRKESSRVSLRPSIYYVWQPKMGLRPGLKNAFLAYFESKERV